MKTLALLPSLLLAACATTAEPTDAFSPLDEQSKPAPDGKFDEPRACGDDSCLPNLCGYDCTTADEQCHRGCAAVDGRAAAFVTATISGAHQSTVDSRLTPYQPVFSLDNVLVYGCELWDFSNQHSDGLEIELTELVHAGFVVDPADPTRHERKLMVYVGPFTGPGSYRAEGLFRADQAAPMFYGKDTCAVDVTAEGDGIRGTFECQIPARSGDGSVTMQGEFGCPGNAMSPVFSRWQPTALR